MVVNERGVRKEGPGGGERERGPRVVNLREGSEGRWEGRYGPRIIERGVAGEVEGLAAAAESLPTESRPSRSVSLSLSLSLSFSLSIVY